MDHIFRGGCLTTIKLEFFSQKQLQIECPDLAFHVVAEYEITDHSAYPLSFALE
jgi:hypothetical protein